MSQIESGVMMPQESPPPRPPSDDGMFSTRLPPRPPSGEGSMNGGEMPPRPPPPSPPGGRDQAHLSPRHPMDFPDMMANMSDEMPRGPQPRNPGFSFLSRYKGQIDAEVGLMLTLAVIGVCINAVIIAMIVSRKKLRKQHNIFVFNLALADFTTCFFTILLFAGPHVLIHPAFNLVLSASLESCISVLAITAYRYTSICLDPFGGRGLLTTPRCVLGSAISWIVIVAPNIFFIFKEFATKSKRLALDGVMYAVTVMSLVVTGVCYWLVYRSIAGKKDSVTRERIEENKKVMVTFSLVYGFTVAAWLGPLVCLYYYYFSAGPGWRFSAQYLPMMVTSFAMLNVNAILNPVVYVWRLKDFRMGLWSCCSTKRRRESRVGDTQATDTVGNSSVSHV